MKTPTFKALTCIVTIAAATVAAFLFSGCAQSRPIKTTLDLSYDPAPSLNYSSEKDVLYSRTSTDPETGIVEQIEFKALSSPAAYAQAERDVIREQSNASQAQALASSVQALGAIAGQVINPLADMGSVTDTTSQQAQSLTGITRARDGEPIPVTVAE